MWRGRPSYDRSNQCHNPESHSFADCTRSTTYKSSNTKGCWPRTKELAKFSCGYDNCRICDMRDLPSSNPNERLIVVRVYMRTAKHTVHATNITVYIAIFAAVWVGGSTKLTVWPAGAGLMPTCVDMISVMVWLDRRNKNIVEVQ